MHPGEVLREEFLIPLGMSAGALARACGVPRSLINNPDVHRRWREENELPWPIPAASSLI
jgi:hypothetical protein